MLMTRRCTIVAAGGLLGLLGLAILLNTATAGKPPAPPPPRPTAPPYSFTYLQPRVSNSTIRAYAMNNSGEVVGNTYDAAGQHVGFLSTVVGGVRVTYDVNTLISEGDRAHWCLKEAYDINDSGQVVGGGTLDGVACGWRYTPSYIDNQGVLQASVLEEVGDLTQARLINNVGIVCGFHQSGPCLATYDPTSNAWITEDLVGGAGPQIFGINDLNQVSGYAFFASDGGHQKAFRYTPGVGVVELGFLRYNKGRYAWSFGFDIDEQGQVVGSSSAGGDTYTTHAMRYTDAEGMVDLGTLGGASSEAHGINPSGTMIVGSSSRASGSDHLFLYTTAKGMMDLEAAIVNLPPEYSKFSGSPNLRINDAGCVCGNTGNGTAFLLTPVP